jgi:hypothetical protein
MRKELLLAMAAFFLISTTVVYAIEENNKIVTISRETADITGDGKVDDILLQGIAYQDEAGYLKEIYIEVKASNGKTYKIPFESGAKAGLKLVDSNHDGLNDLFVTVETGGSGGIIVNYLYTLKGFTVTDLTVPEPLEMDTNFLNGYKAEIKVKATGKSYVFNLKDRKKYYNKMGLYVKGKLNEPMELMVNAYSSMEPITLMDGKLGLKGVQRVAGIANADTIAYVESTWSFLDGKWQAVNVEVKQHRDQ